MAPPPNHALPIIPVAGKGTRVEKALSGVRLRRGEGRARHAMHCTHAAVVIGQKALFDLILHCSYRHRKVQVSITTAGRARVNQWTMCDEFYPEEEKNRLSRGAHFVSGVNPYSLHTSRSTAATAFDSRHVLAISDDSLTSFFF